VFFWHTSEVTQALCKRCASFFPLSGSLDVSNAEGKCDMLLQSAAYLEVLSKTTLNHSRVLLSSIVLVYSETLRTVPLLKVPVLSAHLPDKRAPCILPCYAGSALVPSSRDQDRAAVDHLVFIASSLTSNESSRFFGDSTSTPNPARSGLRCVQEHGFFLAWLAVLRRIARRSFW